MLTFVAGDAGDVFPPDLARNLESALRSRFPAIAVGDVEPYTSDPVDIAGWLALQKRVPYLAPIDAYQAVWLGAAAKGVEHVPIPQVADPLQVANLEELLAALQQFAASASLPTGELEMMQLAGNYLEDDEAFAKDLDVQTYLQLMLSARQAAARKLPLWVVS